MPKIQSNKKKFYGFQNKKSKGGCYTPKNSNVKYIKILHFTLPGRTVTQTE